MGLNKRWLEIIMKNSELADESLAKFLYTCYIESMESLGMVEALYNVLVDSFGNVKNIIGVVVNDEKHFKWEGLDDFNANCVRKSDYEDIDYWLSDMYFNLAAYAKDFGINVADLVPDIDFSRSPSAYSWCKVPINYNPAIVFSNDTWSYKLDKIDTLNFKEPLYEAVVVSRDIYPQASEAKMNEAHLSVIMKEDAKISSDVKYSPDIRVSNLKSNNSCDNPGLIYVPVNKLSQILVESNVSKTFKYRTLLPKHILDKYGLPILEI